MTKKEVQDAMLGYDYAAFCVLDWCDNASFHVPPALAARLDLLRSAREKGGPLLSPPMTRAPRQQRPDNPNGTESK